MQEPHRKGIANHPDPESCVGGREAVGEALTAARAGWVWSRERTRFGRRRNALMRKATPTQTPSRVCAGPGAVARPHARSEPFRTRTGRPRSASVAKPADRWEKAFAARPMRTPARNRTTG